MLHSRLVDKIKKLAILIIIKMKKNYGIVVFVVAILLGGMYGVMLTVGKSTTAAQPAVFVPGQETNEKIEALKSQINKTAEYEKVYGCLEKDQNGNGPFWCGKSKTKMDALESELTAEIQKHQIRTPEIVAIVTANIREIAENPNLQVTFGGKFSNPYAEKTGKKVEHYGDSHNNVYSVDISTNRVVEFTDQTVNYNESVENTLTKIALKARAEAYLAQHVSDFAEVKKTYVYNDFAKGDTKSDSVYFFRWDAPSKVNGEDMLPFVMVKLSPSGNLVGFSDTRSLYK